MNAQVEKQFLFESAIHLEKFLINYFDFTLFMTVVTENQYEQNIAIERANYFLVNHVENSIFVDQNDTDAIDKYQQAGIKVLTLPEEPYDQIIGMVLLTKLNAVMENRLTIEKITLASKLSSQIKFHIEAEEAYAFLGKHNNWYNDSTASFKQNGKKKKDKIVKLFDVDEWTDNGLVWKEKI